MSAFTTELIDAHQHLWELSERPYSWISPKDALLYRDFTMEHLIHEIGAVGVTGTILVQAADTYADTFYMLDIAARYPIVRGIVGWVPFDRPDEASAALEVFVQNRHFKGVRNLTHDYSNPKYESDPNWILRPKVLETLAMVEKARLTLDYVAVNADHIRTLPILAAKFPNLKIVVDHFAKPDIKNMVMEPWATLMTECARYPNIHTKLSGLNTVSDIENWTASDWQPYVDFIVEKFGPERVMMGGDWPVSTLAGDYVKVWVAQKTVISGFASEKQEWMYYKTANNFYNIF